MFSIGEFSKFTGLTVKTLRFYHEEGLLIPAFIDRDTGYRYYDQGQIETARAITYLRSVEFPLSDIKELLQATGGEGFLDVLERQQSALNEKIKRFRKAVLSLDQFISGERRARAVAQSLEDVQEKMLEPLFVAGIRMKGRYSDCGNGFATIARSLGQYICGKPFLLHYDTEYRDQDADFETCLPIRQRKLVEGVSVRQLPSGRCISLVHKGPYEQLSRSYAKVFKYVNERKYRVIPPTREVYLKGPGMIFKSCPQNYLTEIQIPIESEGAAE